MHARFPVKGFCWLLLLERLNQIWCRLIANSSFQPLIIWGSQDNIIASEDMRTLADKLPNAKLVVYEGAKHSAYKDEPDRFKHDLLELYANAE